MMINITGIAEIAHNINKAYCEAIGDTSQVEWHEAPDWQVESAEAGVEFHLKGNHSPEDSHNNWMEQKAREGWTYGPVKDTVRKEHPAFLPYSELPLEQRIKDYLFREVVHSLKPYLLSGELDE